MSELGAVRRTAAQGLAEYEMRGRSEGANAEASMRTEEEATLLEAGEDGGADARKLALTPASRIGRTTDPLAFACRLMPCVQKLGHQYVLLRGSDGRPLVMLGPHWLGTLFAQGLICAVVLGFTTGSTPIGRSAWATSGMYFFGLLCTTLLWMTAASDPGIHLKGDVREEEAIGEDDIYCDICEMWGPPLTRHCRECGVCILKHDHHCVWMGKCIGKGNMKPFIYFNLAWVSAFVYMFVCLGLLPVTRGKKKHHLH